MNADAKLKEAVIQLFVDNFEVLATHPNQYGETEVLEMKIDLIPGEIPYRLGIAIFRIKVSVMETE